MKKNQVYVSMMASFMPNYARASEGSHHGGRCRVLQNDVYLYPKQSDRDLGIDLTKAENCSALEELFESQGYHVTQLLFNDGILWEIALKDVITPNINLLSLLALYGIPFGSFESHVLNAFQPGFSRNHPKSILMNRCRNAELNEAVHPFLEKALDAANSPLLKILRHDGDMTCELELRKLLQSISRLNDNHSPTFMSLL